MYEEKFKKIGAEYMNDFQENYDKKDKLVSKRVYKDTEFMILNNQHLLLQF